MKSKTKKRLGIALIILLILVVVGIFTIPKLIDPNNYHDLIVKKMKEAIGGEISLGHMSWGIANGVWLEVDGFSIINAPDIPVDVKLSRIYANTAILPLLTLKVVLKEVLLESPELRMKLEPDMDKAEREAKVDDTTTADKEPTEFSLPVEIEVGELTFNIARFELEDAMTLPDQTLMHHFADIKLVATNVALGEEMAFNLSLRDEAASGIGELKAQGTFSGLTDTLTLENPDLKLKAGLTGFNTATIKPYLKGSPLEKRIDGIVSMEVNYEGDLGENLQLDGIVDLSKISYTDLTMWDVPLPGQKTTITYRAKLDPQDITVEKMVLKLGGISVSARADVKEWGEDPVIKNAELSYDLPLAELAPLMPWKLLGENADLIRPILEGGGKIAAQNVVLPEMSPKELPGKIEDLMSGIEMETQVVGVSAQPSPDLPKIEDITGTVLLANGIAQVKGFRARLGSVNLPEVSAKITNLLEKPKIDASITGQLKVDDSSLEKFGTTLKDLGLEKLAGVADVDIVFELETARPEDFQLQGNIGLRDMLVKTTYSPALIQGLNADIAITPDVADLSRFSSTVALKKDATSPKEQFKLELKGYVDDWRRKPAITIHGFKTSPMSLSLLASMVPWGQLGESAKLGKEILVSGGTLTIVDLALPKIDLSKPPKDPKLLIPKVKLAAVFDDITVPSIIKTLPKIEGITGSINLENDALTANKVSAKVGPLSLPTIQAHAKNLSGDPKVSVSAKGPLQVAGTSNAEVGKLLKDYGLKSLTGSAVVDIQATFDQAKPENWTANGSLMLKGIRAESHPAGVTMADLKGGVKFNRKKTMDVTVEDVTTMINKAPVKLSGKFTNLGTPKMLVTTKVYAKQLDLAHLGTLLPTFKEYKLGGLLDMNLSAYVPSATPAKTRLNGTISTQNAGFQLASADMLIKKANTRIEMAGQDVEIQTMALIVNDQQVSVSGKISNPVEPKVQLLVTSPNLDIGRLIPPEKADKPSSKPAKAKGDKKQPAPTKKVGKTELPPMAQKLTADVQVKADQGRYRRLQFQKLNLTLHYARGVVENYDLNFETDHGQIGTKGSADLRDLDRIAFAVEPDIKALDLERLASVYGIEKLPVTGPMSLNGQLKGHTGSDKELLGSLDGQLNTDLGPGNLKNVGKLGNLFGKIFSMASLQNIFSGRMLQDLSKDGVRYNIINAQTSFSKGVLNLDKLHFGSDAMNVDGQGTVDLVNDRIKTTAHLVPLATVNKALDFVPILGKAAGDLIKVRIDIDGPLENPKIETSQVKQVGTAVESVGTGTVDFLKGVGKGIKGLFGK